MKKWCFMILSVTGLIFCLVFTGGCKKSKQEDLNNIDCSKVNSVFSTDVKPIIDKNCLSSGCHNSGSVNGDFTTYAGIKAKVDNGSFDSRVIQQKNMPLSNELSMDNLKKIKCWLNSGAVNN